MKANEFFKKFGIVKARKVVIGHPNWVVYKFYNYDFEKEDGEYDEVCLVDLKRLVESHVLVESYGGLEKAKLRCYPAKHLTMESYHKLKQAISDVESCK